MTQTHVKVNVTFQLDVPIQHDACGRRRSITDHVHPLISDFFNELRICNQRQHFPETSNYDCTQDFDIYEQITSRKTQTSLMEREKIYSERRADETLKSAEERARWEKRKDMECRNFFGMSWQEFKTHSWTEQAELRKKNSIVFDPERNEWKKEIK